MTQMTHKHHNLETESAKWANSVQNKDDVDQSCPKAYLEKYQVFGFSLPLSPDFGGLTQKSDHCGVFPLLYQLHRVVDSNVLVVVATVKDPAIVQAPIACCY